MKWLGGSSKRQIFCARFAPHLVGLEFEVDLLTLGEAGQTGAFYRAHMNEHVVPAVIGLDEAKTFPTIEPLDSTCRRFLSFQRHKSRDDHAISIQLVDAFGKGPAGAFGKAQRLIE